MAEVLLITTTDLKRYTITNGNVDPDKFIEFVKIAQDIYIQNYLGTRLLEKIKTDVANNTLIDPYLSLVNNFIKQMLIHWAMVEYLPFSAYTVSNKGVYKHTSENSENADKSEIDFLIEKQRNIAEHYTERFIEYMCMNSNLFPEYNQNQQDGMYPDGRNFFAGWEI